MKHMASAAASSRSSASSKESMPKAKRKFVVCISNSGYAASLEPRKVYLSIADADAERHAMLRVVDESGEDYLYPKRLFVAVDVPRSVERAVTAG